MDPNLFDVNWLRTFEALSLIVVLSFVVERVASLIMESGLFVVLTKIPDDTSAESKTEADAVKNALAVLAIVNKQRPPSEDSGDTKYDADLAAIATGLLPSNPLWPLDPTDPKKAETRARETLDRARQQQIRRRSIRKIPVGETVALALALAICTLGSGFDAIATILLNNEVSFQGELITAALIAGGSKGSLKLFQDVLGIRSSILKAFLAPEKKDDENE